DEHAGQPAIGRPRRPGPVVRAGRARQPGVLVGGDRPEHPGHPAADPAGRAAVDAERPEPEARPVDAAAAADAGHGPAGDRRQAAPEGADAGAGGAVAGPRRAARRRPGDAQPLRRPAPRAGVALRATAASTFFHTLAVA